jgi:hypothetical protein
MLKSQNPQAFLDAGDLQPVKSTRQVISISNINGGTTLTTSEARKLIQLLRSGWRHAIISPRTDKLVERVCNVLAGNK